MWVTFVQLHDERNGVIRTLVSIGRIVNNVQPARRPRFVEFVSRFFPSVPLTQKEVFDDPIK